MQSKRNANGKWICPSCGAVLDSRAVSCEFCGYENVARAEQQEVANLSDMASKHQQEISGIGNRMVKKSVKIVIAVVVVLIALFTVAVVSLSSVLRSFKENNVQKEYSGKEDALKHFEKLYQDKDYEKLKDEYYDSSYSGASFGKYANTAEIYSNYDYASFILDNCYNKSTFFRLDEVNNGLRNAFETLHRCEEMREKGFIYGEGDAIEDMEGQLLDVLKNQWLLTDEEISEGKERYVSPKTDYSDMAETVMKRVEDNRK